MKLIENLSGIGEVFEINTSIGKVNYIVSVFQEMIGGEEGLKQASGKISTDFVMMNRLFDGNNLHLVLEDGRKINFFMKNTDGDVQFSGDFF